MGTTKAAEPAANKKPEARQQTNFERLASIDVSEHIEKKGELSYLSWAWALDYLMRQDQNADWAYTEPTVFSDGSMMVHCVVELFGKARKAHLPVMDNRNKPIKNPDAFAVNTAMQRCLVKAIAMHGLGLYIYAGEDLPYDENAEPAERKPEQKAQSASSAKPPAGKRQPINAGAYAAMQKDLKEAPDHAAIEAKWKEIQDWIVRNADPTDEQKNTLGALYNTRRNELLDDLEDEIPF